MCNFGCDLTFNELVLEVQLSMQSFVKIFQCSLNFPPGIILKLGVYLSNNEKHRRETATKVMVIGFCVCLIKINPHYRIHFVLKAKPMLC